VEDQVSHVADYVVIIVLSVITLDSPRRLALRHLVVLHHHLTDRVHLFLLAASSRGHHCSGSITKVVL
jgi:hypothetical protein